MRQKIVLFFSFLLLVSFTNKGEDSDYISNYYQLVYEAQIKYLEGKDAEAYKLLKQAEKNCPLLNQTTINEIKILAELSVKFNKKKEAFHYIEILMKQYGFTFDYFANDSTFLPLKNRKEWKMLERDSEKIHKEYLGTVNLELRHELFLMKQEDQRVRQKPIDFEEMKRVDEKNEKRFKEIVKQYGYPTESVIGKYSLPNEKSLDVGIFIFHFNDIEYWKPIFLDLIRKGKAPADIYGNIVDSHCRSSNIFVYGIYSNVDSTDISEFDKLDERRMAVGLRPWKQEKKLHELIKKKYGYGF
ncbi:hypothetical protein [Flavobacterium enshiense]|uniref:Tetratricopeptide repeat protein n=1 Tax=Flavobacterium enshiense DK69 TaxID=1107311 RepID=A0A0A2MXE9_9FLAO|nr:hypothetical protein [Flavobacterium enshiense]KGO96271.1 hypothetical protein Q767_04950 [Flavobacterium enshiense DK69]